MVFDRDIEVSVTADLQAAFQSTKNDQFACSVPERMSTGKALQDVGGDSFWTTNVHMEEKTIPVMASLSLVKCAYFGCLGIPGVLPYACEEHK